MDGENLSPSVEARLDALERQVGRWRATAGMMLVLAIGGTMAFRQLVPGPLEASSLTLRGQRGASVTLSVRSSGDLEARFSRSSNPAPHLPGGIGLVLVDPAGREVLRMGDASPRQLAP
jgi:hypothetical protein